jgi:hypothetical protein
MYEVLSQLCFLKPMLKFSVQTFYQPLFSIFPSTILFPSAIFPFNNSFPFQKLPTPKKPKIKPQKQKALFLLQGSFIAANRWSHGEGRDIVTGETCIPASLNTA